MKDKVLAELIAERLGLRSDEDEVTVRAWDRARGQYGAPDVMDRKSFIREVIKALESADGELGCERCGDPNKSGAIRPCSECGEVICADCREAGCLSNKCPYMDHQ